jgi:formate dehydrogenase major subunit
VGLLRSIVDQGLEKEEWLEEHCESPATLRYALGSREMEDIAAETQVSEGDIAQAARLFAGATNAAVVYGLDNVAASHARDCVLSLVNLALLTGNLGRPGTGLYPMRRGANEQGAWDMGCLPDRLPGYRRVSESSDRQVFDEAWGSPVPDSPGLPMAGMVEAAADGRLKAAVVIGDSPNFTNGRIGDALNSLGALDLLVVHDTFLTPLAERADVVLPRSTFVEKDGTYTNLERRVQRIKPAAKRDDGSRTEGWVLSQLAQRIKPDLFPVQTAAETMEEIARVVSIYGGISHRRLESEGSLVLRTQLESPQPTQVLYASRQHRGLQWPCTAPGHPGTSSLYTDGFSESKAVLLTPSFFGLPPTPPTEYPLWFAPGRVLLQQHREMEVVRGKRNRIMREEWVEVNPGDAAGMGLSEGDKVAVQMDDGQVPGVARFNPQLPRGTVASTALFGQLAIDMQASEEFDPAPMLQGLEVRPARLAKTQLE